MSKPLLQYEIQITGLNRGKRDLASFTNEIKRNAQLQVQAEQVAAAGKERAAKRTQQVKSNLLKAELVDTKNLTKKELADHRLRMAAMRQEINAIKDKSSAARAAARESDRAHRETMRSIQQEASALALRDRKLDQRLSRNGIRIDQDLVERRGLPAALRAAQHDRSMRSLDRFNGQIVGVGGRVAGGMVGAGAMYGTLGGGLAVAGAVGQQSTVASVTSDLANQGYVEGGPSRQALYARIQATTAQQNKIHGVDQMDVLRGMSEFAAKTGDVDKAIGMAGFITELSSASGADMGELGNVLGNAYSNLRQTKGVTEEQAAAEAMELARIFAGQGKIGAVEMRDLASRAPILTSAAGYFGGSKMGNMSIMGALAQIAVDKGGAPNAEVATTAIKNIGLDILKKGKRIGFNGSIEKMDPIEAITQILEKTKGNQQKMLKVFGTETLPAVEGLRKTFIGAGGGKTGSAAVRKEVSRYTSAAYSEADMKDSAAFRSSQMDREMGRAVGQFNIAVGTQLLPAVTNLVPAFAKLAPVVGDVAGVGANFVSWAASDPLGGLGAVFAASMAKEAASVGLGKIFASKLGGGAIAIGTIYGAIQMAEFAIKEMDQGAVKRFRKDQTALDSLAARAQSELDATGSLSPETKGQIETARKLVRERVFRASANQQVRSESSGFENWLVDAGDTTKSGINKAYKFFTKSEENLVDGGYEQTAQKKNDFQNQDALLDRIAQLEAALTGNKDEFAKLTTALNANTEAVGSAPGLSLGAGSQDRSGAPISVR